MTSRPDPDPHDDAVIRCVGLTKRFGDVVALDELDLAVGPGRVVGYLGPNGAGKSTTIRILLDLARPTQGRAEVLGVDPRAGGTELRRRIGYLPGELRLDDRLRVDETLESWARLRGGVRPEAIRALCERLDLDPSRRNRTLSSGNRRKVGLVGAFMARPELLILDEPTSGVDPLVQAQFLELVDEARDDGRTVFLSSHVLSEVQRLADEVIVIRSGRVVATGDLDSLRRRAVQPFTVWLEDDAAAVRLVTELAREPGVRDVRIVHGAEVTGTLIGAPSGLLGVLARFPVAHVVVPEPDLEEAFLGYYDASADAVGS